MIQKWLRLLVKSLQSRIFSRSIWAQKWLVWTSRTSGNLVGVDHSFSSLFRYFSPLGDEIWKNFIWWLQSTFSSKLRFWHSNMATSNFRFLVYFESKPPLYNLFIPNTIGYNFLFYYRSWVAQAYESCINYYRSDCAAVVLCLVMLALLAPPRCALNGTFRLARCCLLSAKIARIIDSAEPRKTLWLPSQLWGALFIINLKDFLLSFNNSNLKILIKLFPGC